MAHNNRAAVLGTGQTKYVAKRHDVTMAGMCREAMDAALADAGVSIDEIERTAREGLLMPPKSTFFTPKLKTGAVLRPLGVPLEDRHRSGREHDEGGAGRGVLGALLVGEVGGMG